MPASNKAPKAKAISVSSFEDQTAIVRLSGSDPDGSISGYRLTSLPTNGALYTDSGFVSLAVVGMTYQSNAFYFVPSANYVSGAAPPTFSYIVMDNQGLASSSAAVTISVAAVNDAPVIDLNGSSSGTSVILAYAANAPAILIAPAGTVADVDSANFGNGSLRVSVTGNGNNFDQLRIATDAIVSVAPNLGVSVNGVRIGTLSSAQNGNNGTDLLISLSANATPSLVNVLLEHVTYSNSSSNLGSQPRTVTFTLVDGDGTASGGSSTATATATINTAPPPPVDDGDATVTITGTAQEDSLLTASFANNDPDGPASGVSYKWYRGVTEIQGANAATYTLGDADFGAAITVRVAYTDGQGFAELISSAATAAVGNINDAPTGSVTITGTTTEDQTLTASNTLNDADGLGSINYHWLRGGVDTGATGVAYVLGDADVGAQISVQASYTDLRGTAEVVTSAATDVVAPHEIVGSSGGDLIYGWNPNGPQGSVTAITATRVTSGLVEPLFVTSTLSEPDLLFVAEKGGTIKALNPATGATNIFLDLSGQLSTAGEEGLLGVAFHPDYAENGRLYVFVVNLAGDIQVREYERSATSPNQADETTERVIITIPTDDQQVIHNAGWIEFGPDGMLYFAVGDGGIADSAQDLENLHGKILRISVEVDGFPDDDDRNYAIPADNPFVGVEGADEVWAYGLRNPFRAGFDRGTGELYIADVGQAAWEEIDLGASGANYGWPYYEGTDVYTPNPPTTGFTFPIYSYAHPNSDVSNSITGGYVYRGQSEGLHGQYFFADFISGQIWTLEYENGSWVRTDRTTQIATDVGTIDNVTSFGEDALGNLYLTDYDGDVFRLTPQVTSNDGAASIRGGAGDDMVFAGSGDDTVSGDEGNDVLNGMTGNDTLMGGKGDDVLVGGAGNDRLTGGDGADTLLGGTDADTFVFDFSTEGADRISDFVSGTDTLEISASGFGGGLVASMDVAQVFASSNDHLFVSETERFHYDTSTNTLYFDADGSGLGAGTIALVNLKGGSLQQNDLLIV